MIRTKTTFIVGAGASCELQMPSGPELVMRIAQSLDFARYGAELQTRDSTLLMQYLAKASARAGKGEEVLNAAALRIRTAAKLGGSIDAILEQHNNDPMILLCGKLAIAHFICQAEAKSTLRQTPRIEGDLPLQGTESWLYQMATLITSGVPRLASAKRLVILGFGFQPQNIDLLFDRGLSHQPEVLMTLFDMAATNRNAVIKTVKRKTGLERDELLMVMTARCYEMMRDYSMLLES